MVGFLSLWREDEREALRQVLRGLTATARPPPSGVTLRGRGREKKPWQPFCKGKLRRPVNSLAVLV